MLTTIKKLALTTSVITLAYGSQALASSSILAGSKGTLNNVDSAINSAVIKAERMFEQNGGKPMKSAFNLVDNGHNPYLKVLRISKDYKVELKFAGDPKKSRNGSVPVAKALLGTDIVLVPVYNKGDEKITTFECLTNADAEVQEFMGDSSTREYTASYIRDNTDNKYLSLCIYMDKKLVK